MIRLYIEMSPRPAVKLRCVAFRGAHFGGLGRQPFVMSSRLVTMSGALLLAGCTMFERSAGERNEFLQVVRCIQAIHVAQTEFYSQRARYGSYAELRPQRRTPTEMSVCDLPMYRVEVRFTRDRYTISAVPLRPRMSNVTSDETLSQSRE